jgi:hypothetical protein
MTASAKFREIPRGKLTENFPFRQTPRVFADGKLRGEP